MIKRPVQKRINRWIMIAMSLMLLNGCSAFSIFYNNLPSYLMHELNNIVTLSDEQEAAVEPILENLLLWHRTERLPQYVKWIDEYKARVNKGYKKQDSDWLEALFRQEFELFFNQVIHDIGHLAVKITPQQIQELQLYFNEKNKEHEAIFEVGKEDYYKGLEEIAIENLESWVDELTTEQSALVKQSVIQTKDLRKSYLEYRRKKQQQWINLITARIDNGKYHTLPLSAFTQKMKALIKRIPDKNNPNDYLTWDKYNKALAQQSVVSSMKTLTKTQKKYLFDEVDSYRSEFVDLISD